VAEVRQQGDRRDSPPRGSAFVGGLNVDKLPYLMDIAADLDFKVEVTAGDKPTSICHRFQRLT
jgi:hypothetical protein